MKNKLFQVPSARLQNRRSKNGKLPSNCCGQGNGAYLKGGMAYGTITRKRGEFDTAVR